jgi:prepilin-type N-terminal cleavage/methylation domain-containing protein
MSPFPSTDRSSRPRTPSAPAARKAFTLIELLVVITIISLLLGLALPALAGARAQAKSTVCLIRLRTLGQTTTMYAGDWRDMLPRSSHSAFAANLLPWGYAYLPYINAEHEADRFAQVQATHYRCPLDRRDAGQTYAYNVYFELSAQELDPASRSGWRRIDQTPRPCRTVLFGELLSSTSADHAMAHFWVQYDAPPEIDPSRHSKTNGSGYAFLDGRAAGMPLHKNFDQSAGVDNWNPATAR